MFRSEWFEKKAIRSTTMAKPAYELTPCPACGSDESRELATADDMKSEVELLWEFHERRLRPGVPPEQLTDRLAFSQHPPLRLAECIGCGHIFRNPWERESALRAAYAGDAPSEEVLEALFQNQLAASRSMAERLTAVVGRAGRGLEVGSYVGGFLAAAREQGWTFEGVDVNAGVAEFVGGKGLTMTGGTLDDVDPSMSYDAIAIWNTFEQLYDVRAALATAARHLSVGGTIVVRVPNGEFYRTWRERLAGPRGSLATLLLAHNNLLSFPYRQAFTRQSIATLFDRTGFTLTKVHGDTLVPLADEWTTPFGAMEERLLKHLQRRVQREWQAPWVEVYGVASSK